MRRPYDSANAIMAEINSIQGEIISSGIQSNEPWSSRRTEQPTLIPVACYVAEIQQPLSAGRGIYAQCHFRT